MWDMVAYMEILYDSLIDMCVGVVVQLIGIVCDVFQERLSLIA